MKRTNQCRVKATVPAAKISDWVTELEQSVEWEDTGPLQEDVRARDWRIAARQRAGEGSWEYSPVPAWCPSLGGNGGLGSGPGAPPAVGEAVTSWLLASQLMPWQGHVLCVHVFFPLTAQGHSHSFLKPSRLVS